MMCKGPFNWCVLMTFGLMALASANSDAQLSTNWIAYNDHRAGPMVPPHTPVQNNWGTALRVTAYDMGAPADTIGATLTNFLDGLPLPATMTVTRTGNPDNFGTAFPPSANTPAHRAFFGKVDLSNFGIVGVDAGVPGGEDTVIDYVTFTLNNLDPDKRYLFRGTSVRGGGYALRWSVAQILAEDYVDAHVNGPGSPGILTSNHYPAFLSAGQAAWNSGDNVKGDLVGWDFIAPFANGSISLVVSQYVGMTPAGLAADINYGWSFGAILLAELDMSPPVIQIHPAAQTTVEQNRPFSLSVTASGSALSYQWHKEGVGQIAGATLPTYSVSRSVLGDSGEYYVVVRNPLATVTSTIAQVTVGADVTPPSATTVFSYPSFATNKLAAALDQVIIEFNEEIEPTTATGTSQYTIPGVGSPAAATVTGDRTVLLTLTSSLAEDTDYNLQITGVGDLFGNTLSGVVRPFRSWVRNPANGLLFEAFHTGPGVDLSTLTNHPNYPDHPFLRTNLWAFDTRIVFPNSNQDEYGGRIRGVFIPPASGNWLFFFRCYDRGEVYLNPNGLDPAGKVRILWQDQTGAEPRLWDRFISSRYSLRAGKACYIEGIYQSGIGTDVIKVAARLEGTGSPMPVDAPISDVDTNALMGAAIAFPLAPRDLVPEAGPALTITRSGLQVVIGWLDSSYQLERGLTATGTWSVVTGATSPHTTSASGTQAFYRLIKP